jgi:hypothetical protein
MKVKLPELLTIALAALIGMLVAEGLKAIGQRLGKDLSPLVAGLTASITAALVAIMEGGLDLIPAEYKIFVQALLAALVVVFGPSGIHRQLVRFGGSVRQK